MRELTLHRLKPSPVKIDIEEGVSVTQLNLVIVTPRGDQEV
jgi:hypothetical protein